MFIFRKAAQLTDFLSGTGRTIGFIPTMGALHEGHKSLLLRAAVDGHFTVVSIFVNPTQFNDPADFAKYPVTTAEDLKMLQDSHCDAVYLPDPEDVYPQGIDQAPTFDFGALETVLEGARRPGHFRGVGQVVSRLLDIVAPHHLYLGQKDYQQCMIISDLIRQRKLPTQLHICPTIREDDGLALSSRNRRLSSPERSKAGVIYQCLVSIEAKRNNTPFSVVKQECEALLQHKGFEVEYVALADADTLTLLDAYDSSQRMVALIAARLGSTRLIDNLLLTTD
jgi:pantoate--beta-alanine ligase